MLQSKSSCSFLPQRKSHEVGHWHIREVVSLLAKPRVRGFRPSQCDEAASPAQRARVSEPGRVPVDNIDRITNPDNSFSEYDVVRGHSDHFRGDAEDLDDGELAGGVVGFGGTVNIVH